MFRELGLGRGSTDLELGDAGESSGNVHDFQVPYRLGVGVFVDDRRLRFEGFSLLEEVGSPVIQAVDVVRRHPVSVEAFLF